LGDADGHKVSTHDVVGKGRFALLTGVSGRRWADAAQAVSATVGVEIAAHVIGPGRRYIDLYDDWARLREVSEDGCVLVRPDAHVGWRAAAMVEDPQRELEAALRAILDRPGDDAAQGSTNSAGSEANPAATAAS
jgi:2,4-dichlorophenol 6-monooxygenase